MLTSLPIRNLILLCACTAEQLLNFLSILRKTGSERVSYIKSEINLNKYLGEVRIILCNSQAFHLGNEKFAVH